MARVLISLIVGSLVGAGLTLALIRLVPSADSPAPAPAVIRDIVEVPVAHTDPSRARTMIAEMDISAEHRRALED